jgi:hypothetical protein
MYFLLIPFDDNQDLVWREMKRKVHKHFPKEAMVHE